ncbi:MAG: acyltransferase [Asticcacaulis sp.]|uniref:acyltransferase family protein n=1 Tax=Asticcacaulis sp. TaxID=1872648 RepID=UPI0039E2910A
MPDTPSLHPQKARFYELDILRGVAAILVITFHYKHFFLINMAIGFDYADMPFQGLLKPVYLYGQRFVELFFSISGYVFFWLYSEAVASRRTSAVSFFVARFARLYPLYFVTFICVAIMQGIYVSLYGVEYIYTGNTPVNFLLNLFMVHQWVPSAPQSFNGPSWSISVEVFLYLLFFLVCYFRQNRMLVLTGLFLLGAIFKYIHVMEPNDFARGMPSFFLGGIVYYGVRYLCEPQNIRWRRGVTLTLAIVLPIIWIVSYMNGRVEPPADPSANLINYFLNTESFIYIVLPLSVMMLGLMQDRWKTRLLDRAHLHRLSWLGDISYSIYLLHFPLQLALMLVLSRWPLVQRVQWFGSPLAFVAFMATVMGLGWLSHRYFEMPTQRFLRAWLTQRLAKAEVVK